MRPRTFRFLSGGITPSKTTLRLRCFLESTAIAAEDLTADGPDDLDLAGMGSSGHVFVGILAWVLER